MNEIIMAGSNYENRAIGIVGLFGLAFGAWWIASIFGSKPKQQPKNGKKK